MYLLEKGVEAVVERQQRPLTEATITASCPAVRTVEFGLRRGWLATITVQGAVDTLCFDAYVEHVLRVRICGAAMLWCSTTWERTKQVVWNKSRSSAVRGCCGYHHIRQTTRRLRTAGQRSRRLYVLPKLGRASNSKRHWRQLSSW